MDQSDSARSSPNQPMPPASIVERGPALALLTTYPGRLETAWDTQ
ncbi:hypothetical protein [Nocardia sp. BMG51109]|nr:hypothetical protein [Nocardia sp. BMG51109]